MDIAESRKAIYFQKEMILSFTGSSLSHIIVVLPHIMEFPLVMQIWRNKIYDESYIGFHCSEVQTEVFVLNKKS